MSQASKALKKIAASEEYKALVGAIGAGDYEGIAKAYLRIGELMEEEKKQILEKIQSLPRQNRDEDRQQFEAAFALRAGTVLPEWHRLNLQLKEQGLMEGEVFGVGSRGDPLVRTAEGRVVVIEGATLEKGARIRFAVVSRGEKLDFGRVLELTPNYFNFLLNRDTRTSIGKLFESVEERLRNRSAQVDEGGLAELGELLKGLESIREQASKLDAAEKEKAVARIMAYRRRLLNESVVKLAFAFLSREEEKEIAETCQGDEQQIARALSAPGLFRGQAHQGLKTELLAGDEPKGYAEIVKGLESRLDSMNAAVELMEFKSGIEGVYSSARTYLERMDMLLERLRQKARQLASSLAEGGISSVEDINTAVRDAFSGAYLAAELRRTLRSAEEFYALRGALGELRTMLGDKTSLAAAESALKPYLAQKIAAAFASLLPLHHGQIGGRK